MKPLPRIGVLGGTFNPVHNAHVALAKTAITQYRLDELLIIPTGRVWYKNPTEGATSEDRVRMLELAFQGVCEVKILDIEISGIVSGYTYETLAYLRENYRNADYYYIIGLDCIRDFPNWRHPDIITKEANILYAKRPGVEGADSAKTDELANDLAKRFNCLFLPLEVEEMNISSSMIREAIKQNMSLNNLLPASVADYIESKGLYH